MREKNIFLPHLREKNIFLLHLREKKQFFTSNEGNPFHVTLLVSPTSEKGWHGSEEINFSTSFEVQKLIFQPRLGYKN